MKHVGKMKNNNAKVVVVYRTIPGDPYSALVVGTNGLGETYHNSMMSLIQDSSAQQANELADILAVRKFPDGSNMLSWLHTNGHLKKVPTNMVLMTPNTQTSVQLDELNQLIAQQKGISLEDLAVDDGTKKSTVKEKASKKSEDAEVIVENNTSMSPAEMRSKADALYKEASRLRKEADELDPPKKKAKSQRVEV